MRQLTLLVFESFLNWLSLAHCPRGKEAIFCWFLISASPKHLQRFDSTYRKSQKTYLQHINPIVVGNNAKTQQTPFLTVLDQITNDKPRGYLKCFLYQGIS